ncbi:hypothetical protein ACQP2F_15875 [Actinoplanes sp. CA-030573]|uniref:hypothetical protein n=1 Tax=Actinoplanes sp. CA-030573 TaxID=3239898 RepID=UPI003D945F23
MSVPSESQRRNRNIRVAGLILGFSGAAAMVFQSSHSAFSATTSNDTNVFGAGSVAISDNDGAQAMFTATNLAPGDSATVCMGVRYTGTLNPTAIKLYTGGALESNNGGAYVAWANDATSEMDDNLSMRIEINDTDLAADPGSSCAPAGVGSFTDVAASAPGTNMRTMINSNSNFANGLASQWGTVTASKWRVWRFTYTFSSLAPNSAQLDGLKVNFVWEAQR